MGNKKALKIGLIIASVFIIGIIGFFVYNSLFGNNTGSVDHGYEILEYDVNINVNENNVLNMVETIQIEFKTYRHGIYRDIPLINEINRQDGSKSRTRYEVSNVKVEAKYDSYGFYPENFSIESGNDIYSIKIGRENRSFDGVCTYRIKYDYNLGNDQLKNGDEFYFNIIGNGWNTTINHTTFAITMPKAFDYDENSLGFYSGAYGSSSSEGINYSITNNVISGSLAKALNPWEALTIRLNLPDGYFSNTSNINFTLNHTLIIVTAIIVSIIGLILYLMIKNKTEFVKTVEFNPPDGLNSLEVAYIFKGKAKYSDISSLIIYFANHNYLSITEITNENKESDYMLTKLKDYDGDNKHEKFFFNFIFGEKQSISLDELNDKTKDIKQASLIASLLKQANSKTNLKEYFPTNSSSHKTIAIILTLISSMLLFVPLVLEFLSSFLTAFFYSAVLSIAPLVLIFVAVKLKHENNYISISKAQTYLTIIGCLTNLALFCFTSTLRFNFLLLLTTAILIAVNIITSKLISKGIPRTKKGLELYGKILGFREFLVTAEKDQLEKLVNENPHYFFDILPFTYVLGVSDTWIKKFELIPLTNPEWYSSTVYSSTFSLTRLTLLTNKSITSTGNNFSRHIAQHRSNSHSGGGSSGGGRISGGGGFSGGGGGGGGGRSW